MGGTWSTARRRALALVGAVGLLALVPTLPDGTRADPTPSVTFSDVTSSAGLTSPDPTLDPLIGSYIHSVAWGDPNGDGCPDMFTGTFTDSGPDADGVGYYQRRGNPTNTPMPDRLFINDCHGHFSIAPSSFTTPLTTSNGMSTNGRVSGSAFADLDRDGDEDLVVIQNRYRTGASSVPERQQPNRIYRNDGNAGFTEVTNTGIAPSDFAVGRSVLVRDYDGDGCLDLYVIEDPFQGNNQANVTPGRLFKGSAACDLTYTDVTAAAGLKVVAITGTTGPDRATNAGDPVNGLGAAWGDYDGDGWPDLFVAGGPLGPTTSQSAYRNTFTRRNFLFHNNTNGTFTEVSNKLFDEKVAPKPDEDWTSGASWGDIDRDGDLDLLIAHHFQSAMAGTASKTVKIWRNDTVPGGARAFTDITTQTGVIGVTSKSPHAELADLDNNGWLDVYESVEVQSTTGPQPLVFLSSGLDGNGIPKLAVSPGVDPTNDVRYFPGAPLVDYDLDGDLDLFGNDYLPADVPPLYSNDGSTNSWIDVVPRSAGHALPGAKVTVYADGHAGDPAFRLFSGESQIGNGFSVSSVPVVHVGLGTATAVDVVVQPPFGGVAVTRQHLSTKRRLSFDVLAPPPANDDFTNATTLTGTSGAATAAASYASTESGELSSPSASSPGSVWFRYTAPASGTVSWQPSSGSGQGSIESRRGFGAATASSSPSAHVSAGETLYLRVLAPTAPLDFTWSFVAGPPNDTSATATALSGASGAVDGSTVDASSGSVWYRWTAPSNDTVELSIDSGRVDVLDEAETVLASNGSFTPTAGTTYLWRASAVDAPSDFSLRWTSHPADTSTTTSSTTLVAQSACTSSAPLWDIALQTSGRLVRIGSSLHLVDAFGADVCSPVDVGSTTVVHVGCAPDAAVQLNVDYGGGGLPRVRADLGATSRIWVAMGTGPGRWRVGTNGLDVDGDRVVDVTSSLGAKLVLVGSSERDTIIASGGLGTGDPYAAPLEIHGGDAADNITGGAGPDLIDGGAGDDTIRDGDGNDAVYGGAGADVVDQGSAPNGADQVIGDVLDVVTYASRTNGVAVQLGAPLASGDGEHDTLYVGGVTGSRGNDVLLGDESGNVLRGGLGDDVLAGNGGDDELIGGDGDDVENGGTGDDLFSANAAANGADAIDGAAGMDTLNLSARTGALTITVDAGTRDDGEVNERDTVVHVEKIQGGSGADTITGGPTDETLMGGDGADRLFGGGGVDSLYGQAGDDVLDGGPQTDLLNGGANTDACNGVDGKDRKSACEA